MGTILKIFFPPSSPSNIKARDKEEQERRKCRLSLEASTEDESFRLIKEVPSLIIPLPWWACFNPDSRAECHAGWTEDSRWRSKMIEICQTQRGHLKYAFRY